MKFLAYLVTALAAVAFLSSCNTGPSLDSAMAAAEAKGAIDSLWSGYAVAADRRDATGFESIFTDDAILVLSGSRTVTGKAAIGAFLDSLYTPIDVTGFKVTPDDLKASGDLAAQGGTFEERYLDKEVPMIEYGRFAMTAERGADHAWRIRRLTAVADSTVKATE
ncbi:MAG: YybH family protein [Hyphomicrobiales bacterium]